MPQRTSTSGSELFIVDNSEQDWKVLRYLHDWCQIAKGLDIATGYLEIGALLALGDEWRKVDKIRVLMGDEVSKRTKAAFTELCSAKSASPSGVDAVRIKALASLPSRASLARKESRDPSRFLAASASSAWALANAACACSWARLSAGSLAWAYARCGSAASGRSPSCRQASRCSRRRHSSE